jgi:hypothetical protein
VATMQRYPYKKWLGTHFSGLPMVDSPKRCDS